MISEKGNRIELTGLDGGVEFDLNGDGHRERVSWTAAGSRAGFLVLDRNGNGVIDSGRELFGNFTSQPALADRNGFHALGVFDEESEGGNQDGLISAEDSVFPSLGLWYDWNHDGRSQADELVSVAATSIRKIPLTFTTSRRTDGFGNEFRYWTRLETTTGSLFAVDVFLLIGPPLP
ncbi:MAG TPA: hypothetical protein VLU25_04190 [Acidobacteriota bacterium]|nr:hypothetical protein [Acidobacteriota bacterium]